MAYKGETCGTRGAYEDSSGSQIAATQKVYGKIYDKNFRKEPQILLDGEVSIEVRADQMRK